MNKLYSRLKIIRDKYYRSNLVLILFGIVSFVWFLFRVIPKPSRATYPCIQVAAPIASGFVIYILGLTGSFFAFYKAKINFENGRKTSGIIALLVFVPLSIWILKDTGKQGIAMALDDQPANIPIGEAKGLYPGRVVWVWNPDATNENCTLSYNGDGIGDQTDDGWFLDKNNNQTVIDDMLSEVLQRLTSTSDDLAAWNELFRYFNSTRRGMENTGYSEGEKYL